MSLKRKQQCGFFRKCDFGMIAKRAIAMFLAINLLVICLPTNLLEKAFAEGVISSSDVRPETSAVEMYDADESQSENTDEDSGEIALPEDYGSLKIIMTTALPIGSGMDLQYTASDTVYIDWGDGVVVSHSTDGVTAGNVIKIYCKGNITEFICNENMLTSIDVSNCAELSDLSFVNNSVTRIDISNNVKLRTIDCRANDISDIDLSHNSELRHLRCSGNLLTQLDLKNNLLLEHLDCAVNNLTSLDLSANVKLEFLECQANNIIDFDFSNNTSLYWLRVNRNPIGDIDVSKNARLTMLDCSSCMLTTLDVSNNPALEILYCDENLLRELDLSNNKNLTTLWCEYNNLRFNSIPQNIPDIIYAPQYDIKIPSEVEVGTIIDLSSEYNVGNCNTVFTWYNSRGDSVVVPTTEYNGVFTFGDEFAGETLRCKLTNELFDGLEIYTSYVSIAGFIPDVQIDASKPDVVMTTELPVGSTMNIDYFPPSEVYIDWGNGEIVEHDPNDVTAGNTIKLYFPDDMQLLSVDNNKLTSLNIQYSKLTHISCFHNHLTELDLSSLSDTLVEVNCMDNKLTQLNVKNFSSLCTLLCNNNLLTSLDVSGCTSMTGGDFNCSNNKLKELILSTNHMVIHCSGNQLESIDISACKDLIALECYDNCMKFSTLPSNIEEIFDYTNDPDSFPISGAYYNPQKPIQISTKINSATIVDLSSEYMINGTRSAYVWKDSSGAVITPTTADNGKFSFGKEAVGKTIQCEITNALFPDLTLYTTSAEVVANEKVYVISFNANGGEISTDKISVVENSTYGDLPVPTRAEYIFEGWYTEKDGGTKVTSATKATGDCTLYAHWSEAPVYCVVSFNANGGIVAKNEITVKVGEAYNALPNPTRDGYTFAGWYTAKNGGTKVTSATKAAGDCVLYAHWTKNPVYYIVVFDSCGGSVATYSKTIKEGEAIGRLPVPTRTDHRFDGWYTAKTGGTKKQDSDIVTKNQTLYAHWTEIPVYYKVSFNPNGGSVNIASITVKKGNAYGNLPTPTRNGYYFDGWYTERNGGTKIDPTQLVMADCTLYAHWQKVTILYVVVFDPNGGTLSDKYANITYEKGDTYGGLPVPTRTGYTFDGWYTAKTGGSRIYSTTNVPGATTVYAHWSLKEVCYIIDFDANGGSVSPESKSVDNGKGYGTLPTPTRKGYSFDGWYTAQNGGTKVSASTIVYSSHTLYAHWRGIAYKVTFDPVAAKATVQPEYSFINYGSAYGTLPTPVYSGYAFMGWYTNKSYSQKVTESSIMNQAGTHTLYAKWEKVHDITLSGTKTEVPDVHKYKEPIYVKGILESNSNITNVKVGFYDNNHNWLSAYSASTKPNSKRYDLSKLDYLVAFTRLPVGEYTFEVIATNASGTQTLQSKKFKVEKVVICAEHASDLCTVTVKLGDEVLGTYRGRTTPSYSSKVYGAGKNNDGCGTATIKKGTYIAVYSTSNYKYSVKKDGTVIHPGHGAPAYSVMRLDGSGYIPCVRSSYPAKGCPSTGKDRHEKDYAKGIMIHQSSYNPSNWSTGCILIMPDSTSDDKGVKTMKDFSNKVGRGEALLIVE